MISSLASRSLRIFAAALPWASAAAAPPSPLRGARRTRRSRSSRPTRPPWPWWRLNELLPVEPALLADLSGHRPHLRRRRRRPVHGRGPVSTPKTDIDTVVISGLAASGADPKACSRSSRGGSIRDPAGRRGPGDRAPRRSARRRRRPTTCCPTRARRTRPPTVDPPRRSSPPTSSSSGRRARSPQALVARAAGGNRIPAARSPGLGAQPISRVSRAARPLGRSSTSRSTPRSKRRASRIAQAAAHGGQRRRRTRSSP